MAPLYQQRNFSMTPELWSKLEALAVKTNSRSTRGPKARQHSWQTMIEEIAKGNIQLVVQNPYKLPEGLDEAVKQIEHRQRVTEHPKQRGKMPLKLEQLHMELEPA